jgi:UDP-N-acetylglucosamine 2-epimerase (non-hydrolysing)
MNITLIAGARPNFMKISSVIDAIHIAQTEGKNMNYQLVHTGQHYDKNMSESFFVELGIPQPHVNLESGGGTQAEQTANIMMRFEQYLLKTQTDLVVVVGDVTSTLACSIVAKKLCIKVAHIEAGIRSGDATMPEEINRMVTDSITDYFFTTSAVANKNLKKSGIAAKNIFFVGNTMIDTLLKHQSRFTAPNFYTDLNLKAQQYIVVTLHRPANVDAADNLKLLIETIVQNVGGLPVIFPVHPRTAKNIEAANIKATNLHLVEPQSYLKFNFLVKNAKCVITDSGGITEETTVMGIPCMTLRNSTERPETVTVGTNELLGIDPSILPSYLDKLFKGEWKKGDIPPLWDGQTGKRIVDILLKLKSKK